MMDQLYVFYEDHRVGVLSKNSDATYFFQYEPSWVESEKAFALSPILKLDAQRQFDNRETLSFFENLIPEGKVKERIEKVIGKSIKSGFQFLAQYGADCAGAFVISSDQNMPQTVVEDEFEELDKEELAKVHQNNENLMIHVMEKHNGRFSLTGAQDKIPLVYHEGGLYVPTKGAPTTHILKPPHLGQSVKESVFNEYFCMKLAKTIGLNVASVDIIDGKVPFYITERYDRRIGEEGVQRLHQIDFCQAQNRLSTEKYESDGGPNLKNNYNTIRDYSSRVVPDSKSFMEWICFNLMIGNNDSHSKNISFLLENGSYQLSPYYDLLCTSIYKTYSPEFAFSIGGNHHWDRWGKSQFEGEMGKWGFEKSMGLLWKTFYEVERKIFDVLDQEVSALKDRFADAKVGGRIKVEIEKRSKSFQKRMQ